MSLAPGHIGMSPPALLPALARAIRGLSALFWGLPLALFLSANLALGVPLPGRTTSFPGGWGAFANTLSTVLPVLLAHGLLLHGLASLRRFHPQERVWANSLERARIVGFLNAALVPFQFWFSRHPFEPLFAWSFELSLFAALAFLLALNHLLRRLAAMLPDETLRSDTRIFTALNLRVLVLLAALLALLLAAAAAPPAGSFTAPVWAALARVEPWHLVLPSLVPVALTMTMLWKTKEAIVVSVFDTPR